MVLVVVVVVLEASLVYDERKASLLESLDLGLSLKLNITDH